MLHNLEQHEAPNDFFLITTKCFILHIFASQKSSAEIKGQMLIHVQRNPQTNVHILRFHFPVPYLKKMSKSARLHETVFRNFSFLKPSLENALWDQ